MKQIKGLSDDDFFVKWKAIREKGILSYIIRNTIPSIIIIIIYVFFTLTRYNTKGQNLEYTIYLSIFIVLSYIVSSVLKWIGSEKRYRYIEKVREKTTRND